MTIINGHFDGQRVILDDPVPADIAPDTPVRVLFDAGAASGNGDGHEVLAAIAQLAVADDDLPADFAEQHEHYVKGTPRR